MKKLLSIAVFTVFMSTNILVNAENNSKASWYQYFLSTICVAGGGVVDYSIKPEPCLSWFNGIDKAVKFTGRGVWILGLTGILYPLITQNYNIKFEKKNKTE